MTKAYVSSSLPELSELSEDEIIKLVYERADRLLRLSKEELFRMYLKEYPRTPTASLEKLWTNR